MRTLLLAVLCLTAVSSMQAWGGDKTTWGRRGAQIANCGVQFLDIASTRQGIRMGAVEQNNLFLNKVGELNYPKFYGVKAYECIVPIVTAEIVHHYYPNNGIESVFITGAVMRVGITGRTVINNYNWIDNAKKYRADGGKP